MAALPQSDSVKGSCTDRLVDRPSKSRSDSTLIKPIQPNAESFRDVLGKCFRVPHYQRAYDWDDEEVGDFVRDLLRLYQHQRKGDSSAWHFFGVLISVSVAAPDTVEKMYFEVVDGQQRLATLLLVLDGIRGQLAQTGGRKRPTTEGGQLHRELTSLVEGGEQPRLLLSRRDRKYFADLVRGNAGSPGRKADEAHRLLFAAKKRIDEQLISVVVPRSVGSEQRTKRLRALANVILDQSYVVHLSTTEKLEAYRLFAVLNDRGRPLSVGSLLRTHCLSLLSKYPAEQRQVESDWDEILHEGRQWVDTYLQTFYTSYTGVRVTPGEMFDAYLARFNRELPGKALSTSQQARAATSFVRDLYEDGSFYAQVRAGEWPFADGTAAAWDRDRLIRLVSILAHSLAAPLLLAVGQGCGEDAFKRVVLKLERFVFRYITICSGSPDALARAAYYPIAKSARESGRLDENRFDNQLRRLLREYAGDEVFRANLLERLSYRPNSPNQNRRLKHFLTTLEDYYSWYSGGAHHAPTPTKHSVFSFADTNLEHIYPQRPAAGQRRAHLEPLVHHLGNISLLDVRDGRVASSDGFAKKKLVYEESKLAITRELKDVSDWTPATLTERAERYADMALRIFRI